MKKILLLLLAVVPSILSGQPYPPNQKNTTIASDRFLGKRPGLSINGLDGLAKRSPMLVPIGKGWQETALQVPETVAEIKLMNPTTQAFLTPDVPLHGAVVVME